MIFKVLHGGAVMVEVIGSAFLVALVWLVTYGMSATDSKKHGVSVRRDDAPSQIKPAA